MNYKLYKELEITINEWWDSLPDAVQEALNKVYDKYYDKCEEKQMTKEYTIYNEDNELVAKGNLLEILDLLTNLGYRIEENINDKSI